MSTLNPQIVHDTAAYLFWMLAEQAGIDDANQAVRDTTGECLFTQPFTISVLEQQGFANLPQEARQKFINAVACEAEEYALQERNLNGVVYAEDGQSGRSPSAEHVNTQILKFIPNRVVANRKLEKTGRLCLRHPLPAVVFSDSKPSSGIIEVSNTKEALGFQLPMFFSINGCQQISNALVVLFGVFFIPTPNEDSGKLWNSAIQNSTRFFSGLDIHEGSSVINIEVEW
jgi:hypothetical protein